MKIVALVGHKRSGKDTLARVIQHHDNSFVRYAFADPVREAAKAFFGWDDSVFQNQKEVVDNFWGISPRQALQYLGTEVGRRGIASVFEEFAKTTGDRIWIHRFDKFLSSLQQDTTNVVITDMRFVNEMHSVRSQQHKGHDVQIVGIRRPGAYGDSHASESEVDDCIQQSDLVFYNDSTLAKMDEFVNTYILNTQRSGE